MKWIPLTQGKCAVVSNQDFARIRHHSWHAVEHLHTWYAETAVFREDGSQTTVGMHRMVMRAEKGVDIDHRNGDGLDCRRRNLRRVTKRQNHQNTVHNCKRGKTSRYKGVYLHTQNRNWNARIRAGEIGSDGKAKMLHLGCFDSEEQAARAYDRAARRHFGSFAFTNF